MAQFVTRVELHSATEADYVKLHREMEARGFSRTIPSSDGKRYQLPTAEYWFEGAFALTGVLELADSAASATGRSSWILVTEAAGYWFRLAKA